MIRIDPLFDMPTISGGANVAAVFTNVFLQADYSLDEIRTFVTHGSVLVHNTMREQNAARATREITAAETSDLSALIYAVEGAKRAFGMRSMVKDIMQRVSAEAEAIAAAAANDPAPKPASAPEPAPAA